ncbi:MAG: TatD family hydrolase [Bacteroidia bacterium]
MTFTDTHAHLYAEEFDADRNETVKRAISCGVSKMFLPNIDVHSIQPMLDLVWEFPSHCFPMMGLHPCSVDENFEMNLEPIHQWFSKRKFYAVGEVGLDYYWSLEFKEQQITAFKKQLNWAIEMELPVIIHSRNSTAGIISIIKEMSDAKLRGIFHCFSGNEKEANEIIELGFYLGIGGVLTFKNSGLDKAIQNIPVEHLVLETDAPYLSPVPHRGKRNESSYIPLVARKLSEIKNIPVEKIAGISSENSKKIFGI